MHYTIDQKRSISKELERILVLYELSAEQKKAIKYSILRIKEEINNELFDYNNTAFVSDWLVF
jgi:hypothetical protein